MSAGIKIFVNKFSITQPTNQPQAYGNIEFILNYGTYEEAEKATLELIKTLNNARILISKDEKSEAIN